VIFANAFWIVSESPAQYWFPPGKERLKRGVSCREWKQATRHWVAGSQTQYTIVSVLEIAISYASREAWR
jgi:hypothetical protein